MMLQGNQRGSFHLHIPAVQFLVVVLRNVQAPAEIAGTLIIMTLQFNATLQKKIGTLITYDLYKHIHFNFS